MKKLFMLIVGLAIFLPLPLSAQNVVIEETFDGNELNWTENARIKAGECVIMEGQFMFDSKNSYFITNNGSGSFRPQLLLAEGEIPVDPVGGLEISFDISFPHNASGLYTLYNGLNYTSGILLGYDDDYNYIAVAVNEEECYILFVKEGHIVRLKEATVKMKGKEKKNVSANIKVIYKDFKLKIFVDDIEMTEVRKVNIDTPQIALFTTSKRKMAFDNLIVKQ